MKYKVDTSELFTDNGLFVKKMQCQISVDWDIMMPGKNEMERICSHCNKSVLNTEFLSDDENKRILSLKEDALLDNDTTGSRKNKSLKSSAVKEMVPSSLRSVPSFNTLRRRDTMPD